MLLWQGEAGIVIPDPGYLAKAHEILKRHKALLIADEVRVLPYQARTLDSICKCQSTTSLPAMPQGRAVANALRCTSGLAGRDV